MSTWTETTLGELLITLTDYHANGSYKVLKENVELTQHILKDLQTDMRTALSQLPEGDQIRESVSHLTNSIETIFDNLPESKEFSESVRNDLLKLTSILKSSGINQEVMTEDVELFKKEHASPKDIQELSNNLKNMIQSMN